jgi:hydroxypyruvate isomerase
MVEKKMRFSAPDWCFFKEDRTPETYYRELRDAGCDAVEMVAPQRRSFAREAGLEILNHGADGMTKGLNNRQNHACLVPSICQTIREAADSGIKQVIVFSGNTQPGITDGWVACREAFEKILPEAEKARIVLTFEMLNTFDHEGYEASRAEYGFALCRHFQSPYFKVLLDLYHMFRMGEDLNKLLQDNIGDIAHLHIAGSPRRDFPGREQEIDYAGVIQVARAVGYSGYWGMEYLPGKEDVLAELGSAVKLFRHQDAPVN